MDFDLKGIFTLAQWHRLVVIILSTIYIFIGFGLFIYSANLETYVPLVESPDYNDDYATTLLLASFYFIVGIAGVVAAMLRLRVLLYIIAFLITLEVVFDTVKTIQTIKFMVDRSIPNEFPKAEMQNAVMMQYGHNSSIAYTRSIDKRQSEKKCCGWTGIGGTNVFLFTPWYEDANRDNKGTKKTLPDSCCVKVSDDCIKADSVEKAQQKGFVHKEDCMDIVINEYKRSLAMAQIKYMVFWIFEVALLVVLAIHIKQTKTKE